MAGTRSHQSFRPFDAAGASRSDDLHHQSRSCTPGPRGATLADACRTLAQVCFVASLASDGPSRVIPETRSDHTLSEASGVPASESRQPVSHWCANGAQGSQLALARRQSHPGCDANCPTQGRSLTPLPKGQIGIGHRASVTAPGPTTTRIGMNVSFSAPVVLSRTVTFNRYSPMGRFFGSSICWIR